MNPAMVGYIDLRLVHPQDASCHGREPWNGVPLPARVRSGAEMGAKGDSLSSPIGNWKGTALGNGQPLARALDSTLQVRRTASCIDRSSTSVAGSASGQSPAHSIACLPL
jgi:hypothetical protein